MQIHQLINHGCGALQHHGGQGRVAALRLELTEVFGRHLPTLAGQLEQAVLVDVPAQDFGQVHQLKCLQPLDVLKHVPSWVSAVPGAARSTSDAAAGLELQQLVQLGPMRVRERFDQGAVDPPIGRAMASRAGPVNHAQRRQDAPLLPQALQRLTGQQQALVGLLGQFGQLTHQGAEVGQAERGQLQVGAQFQGVLATGHVALAVLFAQLVGSAWICLATHRDDRLGQLAVGAQRVTGVAQQAELHGEAEAVGVAAPLTDQRQVGGNPHFLGALKVEVMRPVPSAVSACSRPAPYAAHGYKPTASSWQIPVTHSVTQTGNGPTGRRRTLVRLNRSCRAFCCGCLAGYTSAQSSSAAPIA